MSQLPPAGWHPDPLGRQAQRYWDGQQWTEHVADQAGNMTTDPLDGGGQTQQAQQAHDPGQGDSQWSDQHQADDGWSQQADDGWGQQADSGTPATEGFDSAWADPGVSGDADASAAPDAGGSGDVSTAATVAGAAAAGTAAAARSSEAADPAVTEDEASTTAAMDSPEPADEAMDEDDWTGGVVAMLVDDDDPIVATVGAVVARDKSVTVAETEDGDALAGSGTVWLGGGGHEVTVITLQTPGLTVNRAALVAHGGGVEREDAHPGIVGFAGVRLSGAGWVALSAHGGLVEVPTSGGVEVSANALVAFTNDLDVSHADTVSLSGLGVALVSGG